MEERSYSCFGCDTDDFTFRGLISHIQQSKDPFCWQYYELEACLQRDGEDKTTMDTEPVLFSGDAFGSISQYTSEDFGQDSDTLNMDVDEGVSVVEGGNSVEEDEDEEEMHALNAEMEYDWEPPRKDNPMSSTIEEEEDEDSAQYKATQAQIRQELARRLAAEEQAQTQHPLVVNYSDVYPLSRPGAVLRTSICLDEVYQCKVGGSMDDLAPFTSRLDWEVAKWAKCRGSSSTAFSELLDIEGLTEALGLSYKSMAELNKIIDTKIPGACPRFRHHEVLVFGQSHEFYSRDIMECIRALWGDPEFTPHLLLEPQRNYVDDDHTTRQYHDMNSAKWWWSTQRKVEEQSWRKDCTIVPILISSDKTQLMTFRNKTAYPVYMTIGNLPKHLRRKTSRHGQVLLGYLPTSKLEHVKKKARQHRTLVNVFHACLNFILSPLQSAGRDGVELVSGDGAVRQCYPILAAYIGDYPEQVLVAIIKSGHCPCCLALRADIGNSPMYLPPRDDANICSALKIVPQGMTVFNQASAAAGIKAVPYPFWRNLPYVNIYRSITPDILHQLFQGVVKHVISWVCSAVGDAEVDACCHRLPLNHHVRLFMRGISKLSRVTGQEHHDIARFLLALVIDVRFPKHPTMSNYSLVCAVRALLDFVELARYPVHTDATLRLLNDALRVFHDHKHIFLDLKIRNNFNIIKLHYLQHYRLFIELYGTTDNTDTQYTERLHIDLAKDAYNATNGKDEFCQMTAWLDHKERVLQHDKYLRRQFYSMPVLPIHKPLVPFLIPSRSLKMAKHPSRRGVSFKALRDEYGASDFEMALARMVVQTQDPNMRDHRALLRASHELPMLCQSVSVYHRLKFVSRDPFASNAAAEFVVDSIHAQSTRVSKYNVAIPGRFDTAIVDFEGGEAAGVKGTYEFARINVISPLWTGHAVAQIWCFFSLPHHTSKEWFKGVSHSNHFAYVEWFTPFSHADIDPASRLYKVNRLTKAGTQQVSSVISVERIKGSVHLYPRFGPAAPANWKSSSVLDDCKTFYVSPFNDRFQYSKIA